MRKQGSTEVFRITGARRGLDEDVRGRQRRYVISMLVRTLAVILAVALWNVERYVAIGCLVLGVLLPYVAVVIANGGRENAGSLPSTHLPPPARPMIAPAPVPGGAESGARSADFEQPAPPRGRS
ncbi:DUF3099 domain-containing protein [Streptomyces sp. NBC_01716]|uniref:DUF3099 domain-containing protein n=1 Tax=Streptomyces sp. NBC_01716 TaxID=2975917 RepID=UPI002E326B38|nr:DUF3099 domain-containing protein [Streptomyces sp. NBC_01716]